METHRQGAPGRIPGLDGLRGIAVLAVLFQHAGTLPIGWMGVDLFFAISGFLITGIVLDAKASGGSVGAILRPFYVRRALRIFPLGFGALAILFIVLPLMVPRLATPVRAQLPYWLYVSNWRVGSSTGALLYVRHFWSLGVEEQFYLMWPSVVLALGPSTFRRTCLALAVASLAIRWGLLVSPVAGSLQVLIITPARLEGLVTGSLFASLARSPGGLATHASGIRRGAVAGLVGIAVLMLAQRSPSDTGWAMSKAGLSLLGVTMGLVVASVAASSGRLAAALDTAWLSWVGTISYGIYVYHRPIGIWLNGQVPSLIARTALLLVTAISIAALSWYLVERPILSLKRRWPMPRAVDGID